MDMKNIFRYHIKVWVCLLGLVGLLFAADAMYAPAMADEDMSAQPGLQQLKLERAVVCEGIEDLKPINPAITFSIERGSIMCFTRFAAVASETYILHRWYRRDELVSEKKLVLKPPRWSTYSSMQLRESDKGPWRVNIVASDETVLTILRFSVTE